MSKYCTGCKQSKDLINYAKDRSSKDGLQWYCRSCMSARRKAEVNPQRRRYGFIYQLKKNYGLTVDEYLDLTTKQNYVCAICRQPEVNQRLAVDHCHTTGEIRGLLCANCNRGLGLFKDNPALLCEAVSYLTQRSILKLAVTR